jgi:hypothetical protein
MRGVRRRRRALDGGSCRGWGARCNLLTTPCREIHHSIRDNHGAQQLGPLSMLVSCLKRLEAVKLGPIEAGLRTRELDRLYKLEEIQNLLPALRNVLGNQRVVVLVDELDRGWDSSEDAKAFVSGLFQACVSINALHRTCASTSRRGRSCTTTSRPCTRTRRSTGTSWRRSTGPRTRCSN